MQRPWGEGLGTVPIGGPSQVAWSAANFNEDFIDEECVTEPWTATAQSLRLCRAKLPAPGANGLVADRNTSFGHQWPRALGVHSAKSSVTNPASQ